MKKKNLKGYAEKIGIGILLVILVVVLVIGFMGMNKDAEEHDKIVVNQTAYMQNWTYTFCIEHGYDGSKLTNAWNEAYCTQGGGLRKMRVIWSGMGGYPVNDSSIIEGVYWISDEK